MNISPRFGAVISFERGQLNGLLENRIKQGVPYFVLMEDPESSPDQVTFTQGYPYTPPHGWRKGYLFTATDVPKAERLHQTSISAKNNARAYRQMTGGDILTVPSGAQLHLAEALKYELVPQPNASPLPLESLKEIYIKVAEQFEILQQNALVELRNLIANSKVKKAPTSN